jgi:hypothetical protein
MSKDDSCEAGFTEEIVEPDVEGSGVSIEDFVAYLPRRGYIFIPCREMWSGAGVDARLPPVPVLTKSGKPKRDRNGKRVVLRATRYLDKNRPVEGMTWCPGQSMLIADRLVVDGGWIERRGVMCFNHYRPARVKQGNPAGAKPWLDHVRRVFEPADAEHIIKWLAHRVQHPGEKINHALVLGGDQGIGKDSMLEPVKHAVGPWNFHEVSPTHLLGRFNPFVKSAILRVNEGRDLGEIDRFKFYDHTKIYTAAPPDVLRVDEKNLPEHYVFNVLGLIITTNHKTDGIYLPTNDRRHYVAWSNRSAEDFPGGYWDKLWRWYAAGGFEDVAAYLNTLDLSDFDAKAPPPKTPAFWDIVNAGQPPEDAELADVLNALGDPDAVTPKQLTAAATGTTADWLMAIKSRRSIPHRLERCGYSQVHNKNAKDGYWVINRTRQPIYAKIALPEIEKYKAATELTAKLAEEEGSESR